MKICPKLTKQAPAIKIISHLIQHDTYDEKHGKWITWKKVGKGHENKRRTDTAYTQTEKTEDKKYIDAELKIVDQEGVTNAQWWMQTVTAGEKLKTEKLKENEMKPKRKITMKWIDWSHIGEKSLCLRWTELTKKRNTVDKFGNKNLGHKVCSARLIKVLNLLNISLTTCLCNTREHLAISK